jgi:RNA polymerase sigma factor (sigma-70 family)
MARLVARRLPPRFDWRELAQVGVIAMIEASHRFDPDKGDFWPFAYRRVRGAMLDFLGSDFRESCHSELTEDHAVAPDDAARTLVEVDLARAMRRLTVKEHRVISAIRDGHEPRRIAGMLRISEQRVSQLRRKAVRRLRGEFVA